MRFLHGETPAYDLTYSDVFLVPSRSDVASRLDVDLTTPDGVGTTLPLVVANMTAISGRRMAETIARRGGLAILPQDIPGQALGDAVAWVKSRHPVFETPIQVAPDTAVAELLSLLGKRAHGAAIVVEKGRPVGIVTEYDCHEVDRYARVADAMTTNLLAVHKDQDLNEAYEVMERHHIDVAPVLDGEQMLGVVTRKGSCGRRSIDLQPTTRAG